MCDFGQTLSNVCPGKNDGLSISLDINVPMPGAQPGSSSIQERGHQYIPCDQNPLEMICMEDDPMCAMPEPQGLDIDSIIEEILSKVCPEGKPEEKDSPVDKPADKPGKKFPPKGNNNFKNKADDKNDSDDKERKTDDGKEDDDEQGSDSKRIG